LSGHIFATKARIDNQKKLIKRQYLLHMSSRSVGEFGAPQLISTGSESWQRYCTALWQWASAKLCSVEQGRQLYSAGRPSRWALAHILVSTKF